MTTTHWTWLYGNTSQPTGNRGTMGILSPSNFPPVRAGQVAFQLSDNDYYLVNGADMFNTIYHLAGGDSSYTDMWKFSIPSPSGSTTSSTTSTITTGSTTTSTTSSSTTGSTAGSTTGSVITSAKVDWTSTAPVYINQSTFSNYMADIYNTQDFNITSYSCILAAKRVETWNIQASLNFVGLDAVQKVEQVQNQISSNNTAFVESVKNSTGMSNPQTNVSYVYAPDDVSAGSLVLACIYVWIVALLVVVF